MCRNDDEGNKSICQSVFKVGITRITPAPLRRGFSTTTKDETMKITQTTINMAARRGVAFRLTENDQCHSLKTSSPVDTLEISRLIADEPADEYAALYRITDDGLQFVDSCHANCDEWPQWIADDRQLREMMHAIALEVTTDGRFGFAAV